MQKVSTTPTPVVHKTEAAKKRRAFYLEGVDMRYSFDRLSDMAREAGASDNDILVVDNEKGDKRKVLLMVKNGYLILYAKLLKGLQFERVKTKELVENPLKYIAYDE